MKRCESYGLLGWICGACRLQRTRNVQKAERRRRRMFCGCLSSAVWHLFYV